MQSSVQKSSPAVTRLFLFGGSSGSKRSLAAGAASSASIGSCRIPRKLLPLGVWRVDVSGIHPLLFLLPTFFPPSFPASQLLQSPWAGWFTLADHALLQLVTRICPQGSVGSTLSKATPPRLPESVNLQTNKPTKSVKKKISNCISCLARVEQEQMKFRY